MSSIPEEILKNFKFPIPENFGYFELVTVSVPLALAVWYCQFPGLVSISSNWRHFSSIVFWLALFGQRVLEMTMFKFELASLTLIFSILAALPSRSSNESLKEEKIKKKRDIRKKLYEEINNQDIIEETEEVEISNDNPTPVSTPEIPVESKNPSAESMNPSATTSSKDFYLPNHEIYQNSEQNCDISTLQIDNQQGKFLSNETLRPESPFSLKSYQQINESTINFGNGEISGTGSFIKPAKFVYNERNRVAQSSWVAGGYWHGSKNNSRQNETLSRSSSQSSGIGSLTSANGLFQLQQNNLFLNQVSSLPNSRVNSTCNNELGVLRKNTGELSIFSEPAYKLNSTLNSTILARNPGFRSNRSQLGDDFERESLNSSFGRVSQEAFAKLQPRANSSPKPSENNESRDGDADVSFLERKITINISMYSLFLFLSVGFNVSLSAYLFSLYVWH